jgi:hypothetical protein
MKILAISNDLPGASEDAFTTPLLKEEARRVHELWQMGIIREINFSKDQGEAIIMLECSSLDEARHALDSLPLVREKLIDFELRVLTPYTGFSRLFGE